MGLYFPNTDRPKGGPCPLRQDAPFRAPYCPIYNACRGDACPAIDVGPHGRLINGDARVDVQIYNDEFEDFQTVNMSIDDLLDSSWIELEADPTIIQADKGAE